MLDVFVRDTTFARLARPELSEDEPRGVLNEDSAYRNAYQLVTFIGNHDNPRLPTLIEEEARSDEVDERTKLALTFLFTTRGIPQLYYGDELGLRGGADPDNRKDMPWALVDEESNISLEVVAARNRRQTVRDLIRIRRSSRALCFGLLTTLYVTPSIYAYARTFFDDIRLVVLNNSPTEVRVVIPLRSNDKLPLLAKQQLPDGLLLQDELCPEGVHQVSLEDGALKICLPGRTAAVYKPSIAAPA